MSFNYCKKNEIRGGFFFKKTKIGWFKKTMWTLLATIITIIIMHVFNINTTFSTTINSTEIKLNNNIMIYESEMNISIIETIIKKKFLLWKNHENMMNISKKIWIKIFLINNWWKIYKSK